MRKRFNSGRLEKWRPNSHPIAAVDRDATLVATPRVQKNNVCATLQKGTAWDESRCVAGTRGNNRCQSSLHLICHLSKFLIIPQLRRKMKARMLSNFDTRINYFLHMKNRLILHVTLEPSCGLRSRISRESLYKRLLSAEVCFEVIVIVIFFYFLTFYGEKDIGDVILLPWVISFHFSSLLVQTYLHIHGHTHTYTSTQIDRNLKSHKGIATDFCMNLT